MAKETLVVDANVLISALIGGASRKILLGSAYRFITTEFTVSEVEKYVALISKKSGISEEDILFALRLLPLELFSRDYYEKYILEAEALIKETDPKDVDVLALSLATGNKLWSQDKHFEGLAIDLIKTEELVE